MKIEKLITAFGILGEEEIQVLKIKNKKLQLKIKELERENSSLKKELFPFKNRKFGRLVAYYYTSVHLGKLSKFVIKTFLRTLVFIFKIFGFRSEGKKNTKGQSFKEDIANIISNYKGKKVVFFLSPIDWDFSLVQRPQHIAKFMAKEGILYFYIERDKDSTYIKKKDQNLYCIGIPEVDISIVSDSAKAFVEKEIFFKIYSADWGDLSNKIEKFKKLGIKIIYEYVDEISPEISGCEIPSHIIERLENAVRDEENTYVVTTATKLYEDVKFYRSKNFALITNGVEYEHFSKKVGKKELPYNLLKIFQEKKPIIGYYGAIARWMDYDLLKKIAKERPEYNILLIGLDYDGSVQEQGLDEYKNIHILPPVNYQILPRYGKFFDVCIIPFKINDVTKSTSPIKLFEYMAMGKPIVTTDLPECRKYESVMIGKSEREFLNLLDKAIGKNIDPAYIKILRKEAINNSWARKAVDTIKLIS